MWSQTGAHYSALLATLKEVFDDRDQRPIIIFQANGNEASMLQNSILPHPPLPPDNLSSGERKKANEYYKRLKRHEELISGRREFSLDDVYNAAEKSRRLSTRLFLVTDSSDSLQSSRLSEEGPGI